MTFILALTVIIDHLIHRRRKQGCGYSDIGILRPSTARGSTKSKSGFAF